MVPAVVPMTVQPTLFEEQEQQLARVTGALGRAILSFARSRWNTKQVEFHADELREWVAVRCPAAPASADRVLRGLRRSGLLSYEIVNRRASLYRLTFVR